MMQRAADMWAAFIEVAIIVALFALVIWAVRGTRPRGDQGDRRRPD